ncbi:RING/U-box superfamily protein [Rhynchospora pubera]|uniref:RING/U-box superfamily protein n=1 Tax=Rhynchospora pubera TaxID=906938 RepID=A0AAV8DJE4_9POAL|nr:RING/U-box superfamily protein [Rhynchospora pubera]
MGSLCCVAARPHGTSSTSREWPLTPTDPFWRTNASFSLAPSDQFYRHHSFPSHGSRSSIDGISLDSLDSSESSQGSISWERSGTVDIDSGFEGFVSNFNSPENRSENWEEHAINAEGFLRVPAPRPLVFTSGFEEASLLGNNESSTISSQSDNSTTKYELIVKSPLFARRGPSTARRSFITTPVHPLFFPDDSLSLSSPTSSVDPTEAPEPSKTLSLHPQCGICKRLLSRKSPWCPRKIVHSSDMPVVSILSCSHVYHADCLDRTPKTFRHDPTCPVCDKLEKDDGNTEQWAICRLKNGFPRLRSVGEGPSRVWSCGGVDDMEAFNKDVLKSRMSQRESSRDSEYCIHPVVLEGKPERNLILS